MNQLGVADEWRSLAIRKNKRHNPSVILTDDCFSSGNGHPFVAVATIPLTGEFPFREAENILTPNRYLKHHGSGQRMSE